MHHYPQLDKDVLAAEWLCRRIRSDIEYAEHFYCTLTNNEWMCVREEPAAVWAALADHSWSGSWRFVGGLVSQIRGSGSYLDWYYNGGEGILSDTVVTDLGRLGWRVKQPVW